MSLVATASPRSSQQQRRRSSRRSMRALKTIPEEQDMAFMRVPSARADDLDAQSVRLIQQARAAARKDALRRSAALDALARQHVVRMAQQRNVSHSVESVCQLQDVLHSAHVGENVHCGKCVTDMHATIMRSSPRASSHKRNLMSAKFNEVGTATVMGEDGKLYSTQLFRHADEADENVLPPPAEFCIRFESDSVEVLPTSTLIPI